MAQITRNNRALGSTGEQIAVHEMENKGYQILMRNFRCRTGEIDIIAKDGEYLCFVEVKFRATTRNGYPAESVNILKQRRITRTALFYLCKNGLPVDTPCRFDVISILEHSVEVIKNAYDASF